MTALAAAYAAAKLDAKRAAKLARKPALRVVASAHGISYGPPKGKGGVRKCLGASVAARHAPPDALASEVANLTAVATAALAQLSDALADIAGLPAHIALPRLQRLVTGATATVAKLGKRDRAVALPRVYPVLGGPVAVKRAGP